MVHPRKMSDVEIVGFFLIRGWFDLNRQSNQPLNNIRRYVRMKVINYVVNNVEGY